MSEPTAASQYIVIDTSGVGSRCNSTALYTLDEWLDAVESDRRYWIEKVKQADKVLIRHGRLQRLTIPERVR
jgi:hypothetical protein